MILLNIMEVLNKMVQASQKPVIYTIVIASLILLCAGYVMLNEVRSSIPEVPEINIPTAQEVADLIVIPEVNIPTAEEIADEIEVPDTILSVRDTKERIAEDLVSDFTSDRDLKEFLADEINNELGTDLERKDIEGVDIVDVEVTLWGNTGIVEVKARVSVDDDGDQESVKVEFKVNVEDLVRDDDYEDAEVNEDTLRDFDLIRCYDDYC